MSHPPPARQQRKKAKQSTLDSEEDSEQIVSNSSRTSSSASRDASSAAVVVAQDEQQRSGSPDSRLLNSSANLKPPQQQPEDDGEEDEPVAKSATKTNMLLHYGKETLCLLAILLTTMASYQGTPKVGRPPTPRQFFPASSMVHDFPAGNLEAVSQQVSLSELSFVFYYAPWDATSQSTRALYGDVAKFYHREAYFAAINCWQPGGECRLQYSKIKAWPVLMAYLPKNGLGVLYNGPWEREPIMRFVNSFLSPLKRLNDPDDLLQEMTSHDAVVVAFVDLQRDMREWNTYYETAVRWMFRDPFQDIRFSVVTGESRSKFGVEGDAPVLRMYLWNETVEYENSTWSTGDVENWTVKNLHRVTLWMTPTGYKSMALSSFFKQGPVLLFFTPRNMLKESTDAVEMMRQIGMEYYNCHQDQWIREMVREYLPQQRRAHQEELKKLKSFCQGIMSSMTSLTRPVSSVTFANLMNGSSQQQLLQMNERIGDICQLEPSDSIFGKSDFQGHCEKDSCAEEVDNGPRLRGTSMLRPELDRKSPQNLEKLMMRRKCELLLIESEQAVHSFLGQNPFEVEQLQGIEGMGCSGNRSLTMLLMDSSIYHVFAERLGVDILTKKRKSGVLIVDPEHESTYMLNPNEDLTLKSISRFIRKFSDGSLRRHLRSSHVDFAHTHFYAPPPATPIQKDLEVELEELNSRNFVPRMTSILGQSPRSPANRSLLVFFFSSNCAFCTMMSQHLLQIGNILRPLTEAGHLKIVRIDGDKNDLPWPFTVAEYPSLIFFPGGSGGNSVNTGDSRQFVISERNSVALDKILGFVIANLDRSLRIYAIQLTCAASRRSVKPLVNCLASLRTEIEESIAVSLREWRRRRAPRTRILRRLQLLEAFYLETFRVSEANQCQTCDFAKLETYCRRIVGVWRE